MAEYIYEVYDGGGAWSGQVLRGEIIRCRDCKWFQANATPHDPSGLYSFCTQHGFDFQGSDGFCAWAERDA